MTPSVFEFILHQIGPHEMLRKRSYEFGGRKQIHVDKALLITLWTLATSENYRSIGDRFGVSKSTVFFCLHKVVKVIVNELCKLFIKWPAIEERPLIANNFSRYGLRNVIGCIDGCYIPIKRPLIHGIDYYNCISITVILQGITQNNLMFIDVVPRWPGSVHDARVFRTSDIYPLGLTLCAPNYFIIGDCAYPLLSWLITPFKNNGHLTREQLYFNTILSKTRVKIENTLALLKGRFRRLKELLGVNDEQNIVDIIIACCVLHNMCLIKGDEDIQQHINEGMERIHLINLDNYVPNEIDHGGDDLRNYLVQDLWNRRNQRRL
ncbi:hypothetical protein NQ314_006873 [Rhamnusium bicolor]|uniref:DDE Tnp4 domain-containing protein n=1 Tax=Rhamnusium bicolor TaxID=1586634 RepID=A0AAV8YV44_9CUCU|nr:hypothetical protein NQ314_006873 [Rhamnusium bicolor]